MVLLMRELQKEYLTQNCHCPYRIDVVDMETEKEDDETTYSVY